MVEFVVQLLLALWVVQAVLTVMAVRDFRDVLTRPVRTSFEQYRPRTRVIVPFKGLEPDLEQAIKRFCTQAYPDYELICVVESDDDPACQTLRRVLAAHPQRPSRLLVAGIAPATCGQKVHNQLSALRLIEPEADDGEVWVFADSDIVPGPDWLDQLVGPLVHADTTAVTTGYRWLVPIGGRQANLPTTLGCVMNSSIACLIGRRTRTFAWGGSMAVRVSTAREGRLLERLDGALTDDYPMSRLARDLERRLHFAPACLLATPVDFTWRSLANFAYRQYLITRVYAPGLYWIGLLMLWVYPLGLAAAVAGLLVADVSWERLAIAGVLVVQALAIVWRHLERRRIIRAAFGDEVLDRHARVLRWDLWGTPVWMTLHALLATSAAVGRTMLWRGRRYRLDGPNHIQRLDPNPT